MNIIRGRRKVDTDDSYTSDIFQRQDYRNMDVNFEFPEIQLLKLIV